MVRVLGVSFIKSGCKYYEFAGLSTDGKPTNEVSTGSTFLEVDTGDVYLYDEESQEWNKVGGNDE